MTDWKAFLEWLRQQGAEVLAPTNPYEVARFRARSGTHIVYTTASGCITASGFAKRALQAFRSGHRLDMGLTKVPRDFAAKYRAALYERDGRACFFCLADMPNEDMTVEHLVPVSKGGPNHLDNMVLAHELCNKRADNLPLVRKFQIRTDALHRQLREQRDELLRVVAGTNADAPEWAEIRMQELGLA